MDLGLFQHAFNSQHAFETEVFIWFQILFVSSLRVCTFLYVACVYIYICILYALRDPADPPMTEWKEIGEESGVAILAYAFKKFRK